MSNLFLYLFSLLFVYGNTIGQQLIIDTNFNQVNHYQVKIKSFDTIKQGFYYSYSINSNLKVDGYYKNNKKDGIWKVFYDSGNIYSKFNFIKGVLNGEYVKYYESQKIREIGYYKNGIKINKWIVLSENGDTLSFGYYSGKLLNIKHNDSLIFVINNKRKPDTLNIISKYSDGIRNNEPFSTYGSYSMNVIFLKKGVWYYFDVSININSKEVYDKNGVMIESQKFIKENELKPPLIKPPR